MAEPHEYPAENHADDANEPHETLDAATLLAEAEAAFDVERAEMRDRLMRAFADLVPDLINADVAALVLHRVTRKDPSPPCRSTATTS